MRHLGALLFVGPLAALLVSNACSSSGDSGGSGGTAQGGSSANAGSAGLDGSPFGGSAGSSNGGSGGSSNGGSGGSANGGSGGSGGSSAAGGVPSDAPWDGKFQYDASEPDATICVDETATAEPVPLDIYFMLDASTSMSSPAGLFAAGDCDAVAPSFTPSVNARWCKAVNAIAGYVSSPDAAGNQAAIQYFQHYTTHNCDGTGYDVPAVGLGLLPGSFSGHAQALVQQNPGGLNWAYPWSGTPTEGGLRGLTKFTAANKTPGRLIIGILVTDGEPGTCNTSATALRQIAQDHFNATGIHTFMVGISGASFSTLETWASYTGALSHDDTNDACGTCNGAGCNCHHYNVGDGSPAVFIAALKSIQNAVLSCTFQVPTPSSGILNPDAIKVEYLPGGNPPPVELPKVAGAPQCSGPGWYYGYDASGNPTTINLCPASCTTVQADPNAEVKIRIACQGS